MGRFSRLFCIGFLALALPSIFAQTSVQQPSAPSPDAPQSADPAAVLRVPPPPENATAAELEQKGDLLRLQKAYLDSTDYYRAAIKKDESAVLHNKVGICLLLLRRDSEA